MNKEEIKNTVEYELNDLDKTIKIAERADTWQQNDAILNSFLNTGSITDVDGDDVTQLCFDDLADNYGIIDDHIAENNIEIAIQNDRNMPDNKEALADDKKSYESWKNNVNSLDWAEDRGFKHGTNNYFTNVTTKSVIAWVKDMKKIIKGDLEATAEA